MFMVRSRKEKRAKKVDVAHLGWCGYIDMMPTYGHSGAKICPSMGRRSRTEKVDAAHLGWCRPGADWPGGQTGDWRDQVTSLQQSKLVDTALALFSARAHKSTPCRVGPLYQPSLTLFEPKFCNTFSCTTAHQHKLNNSRVFFGQIAAHNKGAQNRRKVEGVESYNFHERNCILLPSATLPTFYFQPSQSQFYLDLLCTNFEISLLVYDL